MGKISIKNLDLYYEDFKALKDVNLEIEANKITAFIGPSGCGKSTLLKSINRMNDLVEGCRIEERSCWTVKIYSGGWMSTCFANVLEWCSRSRIRFR